MSAGKIIAIIIAVVVALYAIQGIVSIILVQQMMNSVIGGF